ncbi:ABC transporter ATP-binding protein [Tessaracoccus antarcticus]|uniref:ABC transporter ATP-binding protein n=1 Tax=Tessaracoccus antarcticus TaxID=2479848 RepID=A0A3M0G0M2_9ACTN|nr:ABC transporter ATP-binding protein [Tessaracoccus antarcticus]RMB58168.1 ABC transporter ATP-binding protein [Tessaracoccus antarcticus]
MTVHGLAAENVSLGYDRTPVVVDLSLRVPEGRITALIGPNGCGKSTLLRGLTRLLRPSSGTVLLEGTDIHRLGARELARKLGLLPQAPLAPGGITVTELVALGRAPHQSWLSRPSKADRQAVERALALTGTTELADRVVDELSGGQRQRAWIAMVLAQETGVLLLDEPTTFLDMAHAVEVLDTISDLNLQQGCTVVMVLHDLNLAARYADHLMAMADGRLIAQGTPAEVLTEDLLSSAFSLAAKVISDPVSHTPLVVPIGRARVAPMGGAA